MREFNRRKLVLCMAGALALYYNNYIYKEPCMVLYNTGMRWLNEILHGHWRRCVNMFRMDVRTFDNLCLDLESQDKLKTSRRMSVFEKVGMFLYTLSLDASNREMQERFQHSGKTISRYFNEVLRTICLLVVDVIKPNDPEFLNTP